MNNNIWQDNRPETVYDAFVLAQRRYGERPFLCVLPEVAAVYGIKPGEESVRAPSTAAANMALSLETECSVLYTSGTTGYPKGCVLTNDYFLITAEWYAGVGGLCSMHRGSERMLTPLPTFHMNAMATSTMAMLALGGCLIPLDRFHPKTWWHCVRQSRATVVH